MNPLKKKIKKSDNLTENINSLVYAIDNKDINKIEKLFKNNKRDIIFGMYNSSLLTSERFKFLMKNCSKYCNISSVLIKKLIKEEKVALLNIIFDNLKFYEDPFIINLLFHYKQKKSISLPDLKKQISIGKYKISTESKYIFNDEKNLDNGRYLFNECDNGNIINVKFLLKHGININKEHQGGENVLFNACRNGNEAMVKYLIKHGININKKNCNGETPLFFACRYGNETIVKYLIEQGADVNEKNSLEQTPLIYACINGNETIVKCLVEHGANINIEASGGEEEYNYDFYDYENFTYGKTPLLYVCKREGSETLVKYLVEHGANVNKENDIGETPLICACRNGNEAIVKCLVEHGANVNNSEYIYHLSPLFFVCRNGNEAIVKYLVEHGADINHESWCNEEDGYNEYTGGETPLFDACKSGNEAIVKYLIERGVDINKENMKGETPLFGACNYGGNEAIVKYLVERGVDINKENMKGETPLFEACGFGNEAIVKYLVERGVDINKKNSYGVTPLLIIKDAVRSLHYDEVQKIKEFHSIISFLVEHGAIEK